jgi:hypothetical protein
MLAGFSVISTRVLWNVHNSDRRRNWKLIVLPTYNARVGLAWIKIARQDSWPGVNSNAEIEVTGRGKEKVDGKTAKIRGTPDERAAGSHSEAENLSPAG